MFKLNETSFRQNKPGRGLRGTSRRAVVRNSKLFASFLTTADSGPSSKKITVWSDFRQPGLLVDKRPFRLYLSDHGLRWGMGLAQPLNERSIKDRLFSVKSLGGFWTM